MSPTMDPVANVILRTTLALLFGVAATHKLRDPERFRATVVEYAIVPAAVASVGAWLVVASEVATVVLLAAAARGRAGLVAAATLLAVYALAIGTNLARGRRHLDCGCAGPRGRQPISGWLVARNLAVAALALAGLAPTASRALAWVDAVTVVAATTALAALYAAAGGLVANLPALARARGVA